MDTQVTGNGSARTTDVWRMGDWRMEGGKKYKIDEWRGARGVRERESRLGVVALPLDCY